MNKLLPRGRKLFLPLFVVLLLGLTAIPAFAADSDSVEVTVIVDEVAACFLKDDTLPSPLTWGKLMAMSDLTEISFSVGSDELEDGYAYKRNSEEYDGYVIWRANCGWYMKVHRGSWSPDDLKGDYGVELYLKSGGDWTEVTTSAWTFTQDGATYGYNDLDWKLDDLTYDIPADTYTVPVYFTMYIS